MSYPDNIENVKIIHSWMERGVHIPNTIGIIIGSEVELEPGVTIYPNTILLGKTKIQKNAKIGPNTMLKNVVVGERTIIIVSYLTDSNIESDTHIGPFAHLRDGAQIGSKVKIGNFVEVKKSYLGNYTKASHLAYLGDATIGENVNFGCGSITVNYDGYRKNKTYIGNDVFVGCNSNLVAPVEIGDGVFIAAGSTVTENIPKDGFSIARVKQITKENYAPHLRMKIEQGKKNNAPTTE